jgi:mRNA-degrading endonuclease RelE of RelBE toxin-antitoxin system
MVTVLISPEAQRQFEALPRVIRALVAELLARLQAWPAVSGVKRLTGPLAGQCRLRTGDYRVQFTVETLRRTAKAAKGKKAAVAFDYVSRVNKIGHRDGFYD